MAGTLRGASSIDWRRVANVVGLVLLVIVVGLFVVASVPQLAGADESYVVLSDSMSPTIEAGAVVFVSDVPAGEIQQGDVVTYRTGEKAAPVTHRVVEVNAADGQRSFVTQGDANEDPDASAVPASAVVGTVGFHLPLLGYVVSFAGTQLGLLALVVVPAVVLVALELRDLWRAAKDDDGASGKDGIL